MIDEEGDEFIVLASWLECEELLGELRDLNAGGTAVVMVAVRIGDPAVPLLEYLKEQ